MEDIHTIDQAFKRELQSLCGTDPPTPCIVSTRILSDTSLKLAITYTGDAAQFDQGQWNRLTQCLDRLITDHGAELDFLQDKTERTADGKPSLERVFHIAS